MTQRLFVPQKCRLFSNSTTSYLLLQTTRHKKLAASHHGAVPSSTNVCFEIQRKHMFFFWCTCTINKAKCQRRSGFCFSNFPMTTLHSKTKEQRKPQDVKSKMFKPSTQALSKAQIILLSVSEQHVRLTKISKEGFILPFFFFFF